MKNLIYQVKLDFIFFFLLILMIISINQTSSLKIKSTYSSTFKSESSLKSQVKLTTKYCNSLCQECSASDLNYCTRCNTGGNYFNFGCYLTCPEGTFLKRESQTCEKCTDKCPVCWGSETEMCGTTPGVNSHVVKIEEEIENYFKNIKFTKSSIELWLKTLKLIFDEEKEKFQSDGIDNNSPDIFTTNQVYSTLNDKLYELPIGSFSKLDGVFIPVPTYINKHKELIESHWIYKQGMWDGRRWIAQYFPRLPSFIKLKGRKELVYNENCGYWAWDQMKDWHWIKSQNVMEPISTVQALLDSLNRIKFDVGIYVYHY